MLDARAYEYKIKLIMQHYFALIFLSGQCHKL